MIWLVGLVPTFVALGAVLAVAEASISRMTRVRAIALREEGRPGAELLERIESDPPRHLNSIYLAVMLVQNGAAIGVALLAQQSFGNLGVTVTALLFTLAYFVVAEAMAKTFGILHSDRAALACAPIVWALGRLLALPTRVLIRVANALLPGHGLREGPFVSSEEIRSMAEVGHEEGVIGEQAKEMIHSILEFGDTIVREVMVPRPDIVAVDATASLSDVQDVIATRGISRIPVYRDELDRIEGVVYAKDLLQALHTGRADAALTQILRPARFTPEVKRVADLLREMRLGKFHLALATDEYGSVSGLITMEDLLEELVGEIEDEYDREPRRIEPMGDGRFRVDGRISVDELQGLVDVELPDGAWDTVAGLMLGALGAIPKEGEEVTVGGLRLRAEKVLGRRIAKVLVTRAAEPQLPP